MSGDVRPSLIIAFIHTYCAMEMPKVQLAHESAFTVLETPCHKVPESRIFARSPTASSGTIGHMSSTSKKSGNAWNMLCMMFDIMKSAMVMPKVQLEPPVRIPEVHMESRKPLMAVTVMHLALRNPMVF